jgi:hypothetical protein
MSRESHVPFPPDSDPATPAGDEAHSNTYCTCASRLVQQPSEICPLCRLPSMMSSLVHATGSIPASALPAPLERSVNVLAPSGRTDDLRLGTGPRAIPPIVRVAATAVASFSAMPLGPLGSASGASAVLQRVWTVAPSATASSPSQILCQVCAIINALGKSTILPGSGTLAAVETRPWAVAAVDAGPAAPGDPQGATGTVRSV